MANEKFTGTVIVQRNGVSVRSRKGSAKLRIGGFNRSEVSADDQLLGFREEFMPGQIECVMEHSSATDDTISVNGINDTVNFVTTSGVQYVMRNAFCNDVLELQGGEGGMTVKWTGQVAERL